MTVAGPARADRRPGSIVGVRSDQPLPFVDEAGVDLADEGAQPRRQVVDLVGAVLVGNVLDEALVHVGQVPQHDAFGSLEPVVRDVLAERHRPLVQVAHDRLRLHRVAADPRVMRAERLKLA